VTSSMTLAGAALGEACGMNRLSEPEPARAETDCQIQRAPRRTASSCHAFAAGPENEDLVLRWIWPCRDSRYKALVSPPQAGAECQRRGRAKGNITDLPPLREIECTFFFAFVISRIHTVYLFQTSHLPSWLLEQFEAVDNCLDVGVETPEAYPDQRDRRSFICKSPSNELQKPRAMGHFIGPT
jgi:hypothetical protein